MWEKVEHLKLLLEIGLLLMLGVFALHHAVNGRLTSALNAGINAT